MVRSSMRRKTMEKGLQKPHLVLLPFPAPGHFIPFLDLAKLLSQKGILISFVTTPGNVSFLEESLLHDLNHGLHIHLLTLPTPLVEGLNGRERADLFPPESRGLLMEMGQKLQHPFNAWMEEQIQQQTPAPPVCIIYDIFMTWAVPTAQKFNVFSVLFNTCGAFAISLIHSLSSSILENTLEKDGEESLVVSFNMPCPVRLFKHEISPVYLNPDLSNPFQRFVRLCHQEISKGSGMLINSFHELEPLYVEHLKILTAKPVWAIGPVNPQNFSSGAGNVNRRGKMADIDEAELVCWLDSKSPRSVVYVSFGSMTVLSKEQAQALATGLEGSGEAFVWAIKMESKADLINSAYLTEGFLERTKERGLVIRGWVPQLVILSHSSVGAFISHCGWNSALESISLGVPILAWPMFGDQHFNSKLFAELGVGIQFCQNRSEIPNEESVRKAVTMALSEEKREEIRESIQKLKLMATNAVKEEGSSARDLRAFVSEMHKLNVRPTKGKEERQSDLLIRNLE